MELVKLSDDYLLPAEYIFAEKQPMVTSSLIVDGVRSMRLIKFVPPNNCSEDAYKHTYIITCTRFIFNYFHIQLFLNSITWKSTPDSSAFIGLNNGHDRSINACNCGVQTTNDREPGCKKNEQITLTTRPAP